MTKPTYDKPSEVIADEGRVLVDGPDHVDVALTPDAASETGERLIEEADKASRQPHDQPPLNEE